MSSTPDVPPAHEPSSERATRASLLARVRDCGDDDGWNEFHGIYGKLIRNVARQSGLSETEADDVAQETMVTLARKLPQFEYDPSRGSFRSWLLLNVRSRIVDHWRRVARRPQAVAGSTGTEGETQTDLIHRIPDPGSEQTVDAAWDREWEATVLRMASARVRARVLPRNFLLFDLLVLQGLPLREVCRSVGAGTAEAYLAKHRVSRAMKQEVERVRRELGDK